MKWASIQFISSFLPYFQYIIISIYFFQFSRLKHDAKFNSHLVLHKKKQLMQHFKVLKSTSILNKLMVYINSIHINLISKFETSIPINKISKFETSIQLNITSKFLVRGGGGGWGGNSKKAFFSFLLKLVRLGVGFLNRTGAEIDY